MIYAVAFAAGAFTAMFVGKVRAIRRENREIEARSFGRQWGGRL
jgi:hypothetical protein